jgi:hypothetical protein
MGVGGERHSPAALSLLMSRHPLYRRLVGPRESSGKMRKIATTGIRSQDRPARTESLYRQKLMAEINFIIQTATTALRGADVFLYILFNLDARWNGG